MTKKLTIQELNLRCAYNCGCDKAAQEVDLLVGINPILDPLLKKLASDIRKHIKDV